MIISAVPHYTSRCCGPVTRLPALGREGVGASLAATPRHAMPTARRLLLLVLGTVRPRPRLGPAQLGPARPGLARPGLLTLGAQAEVRKADAADCPSGTNRTYFEHE